MMHLPSRPLSTADLDEVFAKLVADFERLRQASVFMTGGTGFFGTWLTETLLDANRRLNLEIRLVLLTRHPDRWAARFPHLAANPAVTTVESDIRSLNQSTHPALAGKFDFMIHAAFDSGQPAAARSPWMVVDTILKGTQHVLELAERSAVKRLLFVSSGAVYGPQPSAISHLSEDYSGGPDPTRPESAYAEGKRAAEMLATTHARQFGYDCMIARGFAFVGPHLPLDVHFAAGNFLRDALAGREITISGDGTPLRSYLYAADMAWWLWTILLRGTPGRAYNVGSPDAISIAELARQTAQLAQPAVSVRILKSAVPGQPPQQYVPDTSRAQSELGLTVSVPLDEALRRTWTYHRNA